MNKLVYTEKDKILSFNLELGLTATDLVNTVIVPMITFMGYHPLSIKIALESAVYDLEDLIESIQKSKGEDDE